MVELRFINLIVRVIKKAHHKYSVNKMKRYSFTSVCFSALLMVPNLLSCQDRKHGNLKTEKKQLPNILLIVADDLGYNDLGIVGNKDVKTPNLDQLAKEGVRFTNFYVTASGSTPSRGSLLTGRYPQRNGTYELFRNNRVDDGHVYGAYEYSTSPEMILGMDVREVLFPEILQQKGYKNGIFGKWDLGQLKRYLPLQRGFDQFYGFSNSGTDYYNHERYGVPSMYRNNERTEEDKGIYSTYLFEREALKFIEENKDNPFFVYLPFNAPHSSPSFDPKIKEQYIEAPPEYVSMYPKGSTIKEEQKRNYMAAVSCMDNSIGNIVHLIDSLDIANNTIVIFFSDNGGGGISSNSPLSGHKGTMWEGGLRVPCIIKWPERIEEKQVIDNFTSSLEIFPTLLDVTGIEKPDSIILDGFSILPLLTGENKNLKRENMYWEYREEYAARVGSWKWIKSDRREKNNGFFNLEKDIGETIDLTNIEPEKLSMVKAKFDQWKIEMQEAEPRGPFKDY